MKTVTIWTCQPLGDDLFKVHAGFLLNYKMAAVTRIISAKQFELASKPSIFLKGVIREMTRTIDMHMLSL